MKKWRRRPLFSYSPALQAQIREDIERALRCEVVRHDLDVRMAGDAILAASRDGLLPLRCAAPSEVSSFT